MNARFTQWALGKSLFLAIFLQFIWETAYSNMWLPNIDTSRTQQTVLVTNGEYSRGQDPCVYIPYYQEQGLDLILILVDTDALPYACFSEAGFDIIAVSDYASIDVRSTLTATNLITVCTPQGTPYGITLFFSQNLRFSFEMVTIKSLQSKVVDLIDVTRLLSSD